LFFVVPVLPILIPVLVVLAVVVYLTSPGPAFFVQGRIGRNGRIFSILKLRTMEHVPAQTHHAVTTTSNQRFTPIGKFLRCWKLDELPQLFNVLIGDMSLVGPRPKLPEHHDDPAKLACRPGITGAATLAFAYEERSLARVPHLLVSYYQNVVLPKKLQLDIEYMSTATLGSDLRLLVKSVLRRWDDSVWRSVPGYDAAFSEEVRQAPKRKALTTTETIPY